MKDIPQVWILILNYNQKELSLSCLASLRKLSYSNYKILFVDNASTDNSTQEITEKFPYVHIIENLKNLGCAGGRNTGIDYFLEQTQGDYLCFLDNDTTVEANLLNELVDVAESDADIGLVGMGVYYADEPKKYWFRGGGKMNWYRGIFCNLGQGSIDHGQSDYIREINAIPGGFTFIKRRVLEKVGKLDERYFIYYEDLDWCFRVKRSGYKIVFAPQVKVYHQASSSLGMESPSFYYYRTRNRLLFMLKNAPKIYLPFFSLYFIYDFFYNTLLTLFLSRKPQHLRASLIAILDFLNSRFGEKLLNENC